MAYAGKDELITDTSGALGDLLDRTITIRMRQPSMPLPEVDDQAEDEGDMLAEALVKWTDSVRGELRQAAKDIAAEDRENAVEGVNLRSAQIWRPLKAIGRVADGRGEDDEPGAVGDRDHHGRRAPDRRRGIARDRGPARRASAAGAVLGRSRARG